MDDSPHTLPRSRRASAGSLPRTSRRSSRSGSWDQALDPNLTVAAAYHHHNTIAVLDEANEAEATVLEHSLDMGGGNGIHHRHHLDLDLDRADLVDLPVPSSTKVASPPDPRDVDNLDLNHHDDDYEERTYSSLPPSPRTEASAAFGLGPAGPQRSLDLGELASAFQKAGGVHHLQRRGSLGNAERDATAGDDDEQFWPARSRRQTLESVTGAPPVYATLLSASASTRASVSGPTGVLHAPLDVTLEAEEGPESPRVPVVGMAAAADVDADSGGGSGAQTPSPVVLDSSLDSVTIAAEVESTGGLSLWDLLRDEDAAEQWEGWIADGKWERIANFLAVPLAVEKVTMFGALLCLDGFLYNFTILPIRATFALERIFKRLIRGQRITPIPPAHVQSLLRLLLLVIPAVILMYGTDASKMYHSVRGQDTIKLYVIFNALEIGDRLCCAFGQDVLDTLFARATLTYQSETRRTKREHVRPFFYFTLSLGYVLVHTVVFFYMLIALNVAINSYDYTLISLLISNQFVEIKGSVFKKFEKENLFQIMCADIVERFQLGLMLVVIALRNMIEMSGSDLAFLPKSFTRGKSLIERILSPVLFVLASEMMVDWLKHAFISKFNHVRATVYGRFTDVLAKDVLLAGTVGSGAARRSNGRARSTGKQRKHPILLDQSPLVARRLGIASIPLAVLVIRICAQIVGMLTMSVSETSTAAHSSPDLGADWIWTSLKWAAGVLIAVALWGCLVAIKILLGLGLLSFSALRQAGMDEREAEDGVNDFGRTAVGESKEETAYHKATSRYLSQADDDLPSYPSAPVGAGVRKAEAGEKEHGKEKGKEKTDGAGGGGKKKFRLEEVERWTMVKRIW